MAKLKTPRKSPVSPTGPGVSPMPLDEILSGPRPGSTDPDRDALWLELRSALERHAMMHPRFDPRVLLTLPTPAAVAEWHAVRRRWAAAFFANDARVILG